MFEPQRRVWWCEIDTNHGHATYDELKNRNVVAQGWPDLGDLSILVGDVQERIVQVITESAKHVKYKMGEAALRVFVNILREIHPGDLVVGIEGKSVKGICEILPQTRYVFDEQTNLEGLPEMSNESFNYAQCLYPVCWLDWHEVDARWKPAVSNQGFVGIQRLVNDAEAVCGRWDEYKNSRHGQFQWGGSWLQERLRKLRNLNMKKVIDVFSLVPQVILHGPPGTGKTHTARELAAQLLGFDSMNEEFEKARFTSIHAVSPKGQWEIVQFHPSYNYEDFVRGIESRTESGNVVYKEVDKIFAQMCVAAHKSSHRYVLIIDEINRANLAAVLGELLYALEYRGEEVATPYSVNGHRTLLVPRNLYIIGTMNTADRSIGHLDYAIRRRFAFLPHRADPEIVRRFYEALSLAKREKQELRDMALRMFEEVAKLFAKDANFLSSDYRPDDVHVGHTYFMGKTESELRLKFTHQVMPLLREYVADGILLPISEEVIAKLAASYASDTAHA